MLQFSFIDDKHEAVSFAQDLVVGKWQTHGAKPNLFALHLTTTPTSSAQTLEFFCSQVFSFLVSGPGVMFSKAFSPCVKSEITPSI